MGMTDLRNAFRARRTLFLALMTIAGLMLCLTVMHAMPGEHAENVGPMAMSTVAGHSETQSAQGTGALGGGSLGDGALGDGALGDGALGDGALGGGALGGAMACQGPCGQDHIMMASACAIALLVPLILIGAARISSGWRPSTRSLDWLAHRVGALPLPMPPSLLFLSISRT